MGKLVAIAASGLDALRLHPMRTLVTWGAVVATLVPYLAGVALSSGLEEQAQEAVRFGADLYVTAHQFGRTAPVPLALGADIRKIEGITDVVPRIVGHISLGRDRESAVLVGIPANRLPSSARCVSGRLFQDGETNEFVVGSELAYRLRLEIGSLIPPFYRNVRGERVSKVVGLFESDIAIWQSRMMFASIETAAAVFDHAGYVTDLLVYCRPGYETGVRTTILQTLSDVPRQDYGRTRLRVATREDVQSTLSTNVLHRGGVFNLHFLVAFVVGIGVVTVTSGIGLPERWREIGTLKATGWQTDEVLLRSLVESLLLSLSAAVVGIVLAFVWLKWLNGFWIAGIVLGGADAVPHFRVPFRITPIPALLSFVVSFALVMTGTLYSTWRAAMADPSDAMR